MTRSPATMPWPVAPSVTAASPREDARHGRAAVDRSRARHGGEVECSPNGSLGVVLLCDRRAPDRHDGVADELLDRAAVALDHVRAVEVPAQQLARLLRVPPLRGCGEPDEVDEQDRDEAALGCRCGCAAGGRAWRVDLEQHSAVAAEPLAGCVHTPARRAHRRERAATVATEPLPGWILGATARTDDHVKSLTRIPPAEGNERTAAGIPPGSTPGTERARSE